MADASCNRASLDAPVAIHAVERFLGDLAADKGWRVPVAPPSGKKVLVVGAGPGGLACAYHLARMGHQAEIRDSAEEPGGMMASGIPAYRLPRAPLRKEIGRITAMAGIALQCGQRVDDVVAEKQKGGFDAVFVAVGAQEANHLNIPAMDGKKIIDAVSLLGQVREGRAPKLGRAVAVIGGGNTAVDAACTARRLGEQDALLVYRSDVAHMRAQPAEASEAFAEGVKIKWLSTVGQFGAGGIVIEKLQMDPDGSVTPTGETERIGADSVVLAVGQHSDLSLLCGAPGVKITPDDVVEVNEVLMTGHPGIFASGDCIGGARTMTIAVGHGKLAARAIDAWMRGETYQHPISHPLVTFDMLHLLSYLDAPRSEQEKVRSRSGPGSAKLSRVLRNRRRAMRPSAACPAATVSNVITATRPAPNRRSPAWAQVTGTALTRIFVPAAQRVSSSAPVMPLRWCPNRRASLCLSETLTNRLRQAVSRCVSRSEHDRTDAHHRRQHSGYAYRLSRERGLCHLSDHALVSDGGLADVWSDQSIRNIWGSIPAVQEMQSEGAPPAASMFAAKRRSDNDLHCVAGSDADAA